MLKIALTHFADICTVISIKVDNIVPGTLQDCIDYYATLRKDYLTQAEMSMLLFLYKRNKIIHEYDRQEEIRDNYRRSMLEFSPGLAGLAKDIEKVAVTNSILDYRIRKR